MSGPKKGDLNHLEWAVLDILKRDRSYPDKWRCSADVHNVYNAERKRKGKTWLSSGSIRNTLKGLHKKGLIMFREIEDNGRIRHEWREAQ